MDFEMSTVVSTVADGDLQRLDLEDPSVVPDRRPKNGWAVPEQL